MCVHVCVHVCVYTCVCTRVCVCIHMCVYTCVCTRVCVGCVDGISRVPTTSACPWLPGRGVLFSPHRAVRRVTRVARFSQTSGAEPAARGETVRDARGAAAHLPQRRLLPLAQVRGAGGGAEAGGGDEERRSIGSKQKHQKIGATNPAHILKEEMVRSG